MPEIRTSFLEIGSLVAQGKSGDPLAIIFGPSVVSFIEVEDANFHHDSAVLMPESPTESKGDVGSETPAQARVTGLDAIAACLREAERNPKKLLLVAGHTDRSGGDAYNIQLSELRAQNVLASLKGDREGWVDVADKKHKVEDYQQILKWVSVTKGWPCDPGDIDNVNGTKTKAAVKAFQVEYNKAFKQSIKEDGIVGKQTWGAVFDVYEERLVEVMNILPEKLNGTRDAMQFLDDGKPFVGCGESWPVERPDEDGLKIEANRRVEVLFFDEKEKPRLECHPASGQCKKDLCDIYNPARLTRIPIPIPPIPKPGPVDIGFSKIETTDPSPAPGGPAFHSDDDFLPLLDEKARFHVKVANLKDGFTGKLKMEIGRLTDKADDPATADVNESFALIKTLEKDVTAGPDPVIVELEWDGKAGADLPEQFSDRKTRDNTASKDVNVPMWKIESGKIVRHGLYHVGSVSILKDGGTIARKRFDDVAVSVPVAANLTFNANWAGTVAAFGLAPFRAQIEEALRRHVGRDYRVRNASRASRMNVRPITDPGKKNTDTIFASIGGSMPGHPSLFGQSLLVHGSRFHNIFVMEEAATSADSTIDVFPDAFLFFNGNKVPPADRKTFRQAFSPMGVKATATPSSPGTPDARTVSGGKVTGAASGVDVANIDLTLSADGVASVTPKDPAIVPPARAADIRRAFNTFVKMVGNTMSHELGHSLGITAPNDSTAEVKIGSTTLRTPLPQGAGKARRGHNPASEESATNIMDAGFTRSFPRRVEASGFSQQKFSARNNRYLLDCLPFAPKDL